MLEFDICFKDTDSDTGVVDEVVLATAKELKGAMWIKAALEMHWGEEDKSREFFVQEREVTDAFEEDEVDV